MDNIDYDRLRAGDRAIWHYVNTVCRRYFIARILSGSLHGVEEAEDAYQDAIIDLIEDLHNGKVKPTGVSLKKYIFRICRYRYLNNLNKRNSLEKLHAEGGAEHHDDSGTDPPADEYIRQHLEILRHYLPLLRTRERKLLRLCLSGKYDMAAIAEIMNLKDAATAINMKYYVMQKLREMARGSGKP